MLPNRSLDYLFGRSSWGPYSITVDRDRGTWHRHTGAYMLVSSNIAVDIVY